MRKHNRTLVIPDIHAPLHDRAAFNCLLKCIPLIKPWSVVILGDLCELESVSPWRKKNPPDVNYILPFIDKDVKHGTDVLAQLETEFQRLNRPPAKYFCEGNHEVWLDNFVERNTLAADKYNPFTAFRLEEFGYEYYPYGQYLRIGELNFYHGGHYTGIYHAMKHVRTLADNVVYAHMHDIQRSDVQSLKGTHAAWCIGSLKSHAHEDNKWLKGRKHNWSHAFAVVHWMDRGTFRLETVDITEGKTIFEGELIDGNEEHLEPNCEYGAVWSGKS